MQLTSFESISPASIDSVHLYEQIALEEEREKESEEKNQQKQRKITFEYLRKSLAVINQNMTKRDHFIETTC